MRDWIIVFIGVALFMWSSTYLIFSLENHLQPQIRDAYIHNCQYKQRDNCEQRADEYMKANYDPIN